MLHHAVAPIISRFNARPHGEFGFLPNCNLGDLDRVVAIVGANGVGKSKLLEYLASEIWAANRNETITYSRPSPIRPVVAHIPDKLAISNKAANTYDSLFISNLNRLMPSALTVMNELALQYALSFVMEIETEETQRSQARNRWNQLKSMVEEFLGDAIYISPAGSLLFHGLQLNEHTLSRGQARLIQLAVALSAVQQDEPLVIIWDEPELHLHPKAVIRVMERLLEQFNCQIWLATHSLSLAAWAGIENVWHMTPSMIVRGTKVKREVIDSIYGDDDQEARLMSFLSASHDLAALEFSAACLGAGHQRGDAADPAQDLLFEAIQRKPGPLTILDWGAGSGRFLPSALDRMGGPAIFAKRCDYVAFDTSDIGRASCIETLAKLYPDATKRWIEDEVNLRARFADQKADVTLLVNVLHEIDPTDWISSFELIRSCLNKNGYLVLVESLWLRASELAKNSSGLIFLDEGGIYSLFAGTGSRQEISVQIDRENGLICAVIPAARLALTQAQLRSCLGYCADAAGAAVRQVRDNPDGSYRQGLMHMRAAMQFVNAHLALNRLGPI